MLASPFLSWFWATITFESVCGCLIVPWKRRLVYRQPACCFDARFARPWALAPCTFLIFPAGISCPRCLRSPASTANNSSTRRQAAVKSHLRAGRLLSFRVGVPTSGSRVKQRPKAEIEAACDASLTQKVRHTPFRVVSSQARQRWLTVTSAPSPNEQRLANSCRSLAVVENNDAAIENLIAASEASSTGLLRLRWRIVALRLHQCACRILLPFTHDAPARYCPTKMK